MIGMFLIAIGVFAAIPIALGLRILSSIVADRVPNTWVSISAAYFGFAVLAVILPLSGWYLFLGQPPEDVIGRSLHSTMIQFGTIASSIITVPTYLVNFIRQLAAREIEP